MCVEVFDRRLHSTRVTRAALTAIFVAMSDRCCGTQTHVQRYTRNHVCGGGVFDSVPQHAKLGGPEVSD